MKLVNSNHIDRALKKAICIFKSGIIEDSLVNKSGKIENPIPIHEPKGDVVSWFVGITVKDRIVGFIQLNINLDFIRYSIFHSKLQNLEGFPKACSWLDPKYILELARINTCSQDVLATPFLTYDGNPSRIVWAVKAESKNGQLKTIYVAGEFVYIIE